MEFFTKTMAVKLRSHLDKYLAANNNGQTVHQNRNGSAVETTWLVELTEPRSNKIRLKSFEGKYLTASVTPFLLGVTGNQVLQTFLGKVNDLKVEWEPIRDGFQVKLKSWCSTFLRANGGTPPWRNSVTHYEADMDGTMNWVLWDVEAVDVPAVTGTEVLPAEFCLWSPSANKLSLNHKTKTDNGMELFNNAKAVRLRSHHDKYLHADDDEETVTQDRNGSSPNSKWAVEPVPGFDSIIRLKSVYNKYLTASNQPFLLGMTGRKVLQTRPNRLDSSVEWEPVRDGHQVKLKTRYGNFLRANGGLPPWRNSVTHDIPHRSSTQEWIVWDVDVVEIVVKSPAGQPGKVSVQPVVAHSDSLDFDDSVRGETTSSVSAKSGNFARQESTDSTMSSPPKSEGRTIYYQVADESGEADEDVMECHSLNFKGNGVDELTQQLKAETGLQDIVVCTRSPLNGKLFPLRLQLPPNNANMHVIVVESSSKAAKNFANGMPPR